MAAAKKPALKKLLDKGLTGREAGILVMMDSWEVDHDRPGLFTDAEIERIKRSLVFEQDIRDYNALIETYRLIDFTTKGAQIQYLDTKWKIYLLSMMLLELDPEGSRWLSVPKIMTEKQYQEDKAEQREYKLREYHPWYDIVRDRANELLKKAPELDGLAVEDMEELEDVEELSDEGKARLGRTAWEEAFKQILKLVEAGKLTPARLKRKYKTKIDALEQEAEQHRQRCLEEMHRPDDLSVDAADKMAMLYANESFVELQKVLDEKAEVEKQAFQEVEVPADKETLKSSITDKAKAMLKKGLPSWETGDNDFLYTYHFIGQELYQAVPEQREWIDEYIPGYPDKEYLGVAIIQEPDSFMLDERGHYAQRTEPERMEHLMEGASIMLETLTESIRSLLSYQALLKALAELLDVPLTEDIDEWMTELKRDIKMYNFGAARPGFPPIVMDKLRPSGAQLQYLRERMEQTLGDEWWRETVYGLLTLEGKPREYVEKLRAWAEEGRVDG